MILPVSGEDDVELEEEEELYELALLPNGDRSDSSEAEAVQGEEESENDSAGCQKENKSDLQRSIIEDIRFVFIMFPFVFIS